jgi:hypothetical protein
MSIMKIGRRSSRRRGVVRALLAVGVAAATVLPTTPAAADVVTIFDDSHVLDVSRVQNEAATLPEPVGIYTTTKLAGDNAAFDRQTQSHVATPTMIVIAVNTQSHHLAIRTGPRSRVAQNDAVSATQAFVDAYRTSGHYTDATLAALDNLRAAIARAAGGRNNASRGGGTSILSWLLCLGLVAAVAVAAVFFARRLRHRQAPTVAPTYGGGYPGGGPGYYPPPQQRSGVNPWVVGGVAAAAGGILGYELAESMDDDDRSASRGSFDGSGFDAGGFGSGGADADFGGSGGFGDPGGGDSF